MNVWDPAGQEISEVSCAAHAAKLEERFKKYQEHPEKLQRADRWLKAVGVAGFLMAFPLMYFELFQVGLMLGAFGFVIWGVYRVYIKSAQADLVNLLVARRNQWIYDPDQDRGRWGNLGMQFPQIFNQGTQGQYIENQYWGSIEEASKKLDFWLGSFYFEVKQGKNSIPFRKAVIVVRLPKPLPYPVYLHSRALEAAMTGLFRRKGMQTENAVFNSAFDIYFDEGDLASAQSEAVRLISPAVQERLLKLQEARGSFSLLLQGECAIFSFSKEFFKPKYTDFFKFVALDPRDEADQQAFFKDIFGLMGDMIRFLD